MTRARQSQWLTAFVVVVMLVLEGCAAPGTLADRGRGHRNDSASPSPRIQTHFWRLDDLLKTAGPTAILQSPSGIHARLETGLLHQIAHVGKRIIQSSGGDSQPDLVVIASHGINAYAFHEGERPTIGFTLGMIRLLSSDLDAWAALLGHELAHIRLAHIEDMRERRERAEVTSSFAGLLLSAIGLPFANVAADAATLLADRAYSRSDERDADRIGLDYMRKAGFAVEGAITLQQRLLGAGTNSSLPFLGTHPSGDERIAVLRELIRGGE